MKTRVVIDSPRVLELAITRARVLLGFTAGATLQIDAVRWFTQDVWWWSSSHRRTSDTGDRRTRM